VRILIVSQYFWPETFRINDLVKSLVEGGAVVDVLTGKPNYPEGDIYSGFRIMGVQQDCWKDAQVFRIPLIPRGRKGAVRLALNYISFVISGLFCGSWILRGKQYDVVFVYGVSPILQAIPALFLGWLKRKPVVVWVQDLWPESLAATGYISNLKILDFVRYAVSIIYKKSDMLLVQSQAFVPFVAVMAARTPVIYYPNSVDDTFTQSSPQVPLPVIASMDSGFCVLFAGNIGAGQSVEVIVEAATLLKDHPEIRFVVIGDGSRREWMLKQVEVLALENLHLPGRFPIETMPGLMRKAGALLVSLTDEAIFAATVPNKIQAYMAVGRPILASLNGEGARLVTQANAGLVSPAGDAKRLADTVLQLYNMPQIERDRLGDNGRSFFRQHFDNTMLTERLIELLNLAVKSKKASS